MTKTKSRRVKLGSVYLGEKFIYRTADLLGEDFTGRKPPFEGQELTVVGFKPSYVNNVVVRDPSGRESLLPLGIVEMALRRLVQRLF